MKSMIFLTFLFFSFNSLRGEEALGVAYDEVYVVRLKYPKALEEKSWFSLRGKSNHRVKYFENEMANRIDSINETTAGSNWLVDL